MISAPKTTSGRNRRAGELIASGATPAEAVAEIGMVVEGLTTAPVLRDLSHRLGIELHPDVLPLSNLPAVLPPFLLRADRAMSLA